MGELRILDVEQGDLRIEWDPAREAEVEAARTQFEAMRAKGYLAYRLRPSGGRGVQLTAFDPAAERIVMAPALRGGT
jgi:hypothetical protein